MGPWARGPFRKFYQKAYLTGVGRPSPVEKALDTTYCILPRLLHLMEGEGWHSTWRRLEEGLRERERDVFA